MPAQFTLFSDTRAVNSIDPPGDANALVRAANAMGATFSVLNAAYAGGADPTGAADSAAAFQAAQAAIPATGGCVTVPPGTYKIGSTVGPMTTNEWIICAPGVIINFTGTGDCFLWTDSSTYTTRTLQGGGILGRPIINGSGDGAGSCAVHAGDILSLRIDVAVRNFSKAGDIAVHFDNQVYWAEQAVASIWTDNCTQDVVFDCSGATTSAGSYDRGKFTIYLSHKTFTGDCITFQNGAYIVGGRLEVFGNIASSASVFTHSVFTITGSASAGHPAGPSGLAQCELNVNLESDGALANTFRTISFGSTANGIINCSGNVSFGPGNQFTNSNITTVSGQFTFIGPVIGDISLNESSFTGRLAVPSSASFFSSLYIAQLGGTPATPSAGDILYTDSGGTLHNLRPDGVDVAFPELPFTPAEAGVIAWNFDPGLVQSSSIPASGAITLIRVNLRSARSITNVAVGVGVIGSGLTSGQNFAGLYAGQTAGAYTAGQLIGVSADQTTPWGTTGLKTAALAGGPFAVPAGFCWVAILSNVSTTVPSFIRGGAQAAAFANAGCTASTARWATSSSTGTTLPSTITPSASALTGITYWAAVS
jgi:hypothetical protein